MSKAMYTVRDTVLFHTGKFYNIKILSMMPDVEYTKMSGWLKEYEELAPKAIANRTGYPRDWWLREDYFTLFVLAFGEGYIDD